MLRTFIDNAIKYTPAGGYIYLSCEADETYLVFKVRDTGTSGSQRNIWNGSLNGFTGSDLLTYQGNGWVRSGLSIAKYIAKGTTPDWN